jgi:hypothetical protein
VNAELQHAPVVSETRQVGVPALAGLSAPAKGDRVNAELQRAPATSETRPVGVPALDTAKPEGRRRFSRSQCDPRKSVPVYRGLQQ